MVRLASTAHGQGVFAERPYAAGEVILVFTGEELTSAEADRRGVRHHCLDIGPGRQLYADPPARFLNHSCDPNAGLIDAVTLAAVRPVSEGAEISFDYSTCVPDPSWTLECRCGASSCRGLVAGWPALDARTKRRLRALKIVPAWLLRRVSGKRPPRSPTRAAASARGFGGGRRPGRPGPSRRRRP